MIQLLVGTVPGVGRYILRIEPSWKTEYLRDDEIIETGRMLKNSESMVWDDEYGNVEKTTIVLEILGPGKCFITVNGPDDISGRTNIFRFYRVNRRLIEAKP